MNAFSVTKNPKYKKVTSKLVINMIFLGMAGNFAFTVAQKDNVRQAGKIFKDSFVSVLVIAGIMEGIKLLFIPCIAFSIKKGKKDRKLELREYAKGALI